MGKHTGKFYGEDMGTHMGTNGSPFEKYDFVSWDDDIPIIWKNNPNVPNHQPVYNNNSV
jgi:hypothetical protein